MSPLVIPTLRSHLTRVIISSCQQAPPHSLAFAIRVLGEQCIPQLQTRLGKLNVEGPYGGYPEVASMGFMLNGQNRLQSNWAEQFLHATRRQQSRSSEALSTLAADDVAILGIADGVAKLSSVGETGDHEAVRKWLVELVGSMKERAIWTSRAQQLAGDLLDNRGRLRVSPSLTNATAGALEICLRGTWGEQFKQVAVLGHDEYQHIFASMLREEPPGTGQFEEAVVWLKAVDLLIEHTTEALFPRSDRERDATNLLAAVKAKLDKAAENEAKQIIRLVVGAVVLYWLVFFVLVSLRGWEAMNTWASIASIVFTLGGYVYFAIAQRDVTLRGLFDQIAEGRRKTKYRQAGFDIVKYNQLYNRSPSFGETSVDHTIQT